MIPIFSFFKIIPVFYRDLIGHSKLKIMGIDRIYLRIKRKRDVDPLDNILVHAKSAKLDLNKNDIACTMQNLSTSDAAYKKFVLQIVLYTNLANIRFVFHRIDTMEGVVGSDSNLAKKRARTYKRKRADGEVISNKSLKRVNDHVEFVDVAAKGSTSAHNNIVMNGRALVPNRVLTPMERGLDEAIWNAFVKNDFSKVFSKQSGSRDINFQRPVDGLTVLMCAAKHNRADIMDQLLRFDVQFGLQNTSGQSASDIAEQEGNSEIRDALYHCEMLERNKDFVFDVYAIHNASTLQASTSGKSIDDESATLAAPVFQVPEKVQQWLHQADLLKEEEIHVQDASDDIHDNVSDNGRYDIVYSSNQIE